MDPLGKEISVWKKKYPFLQNVWKLFEEFNHDLMENDDLLRALCKDNRTYDRENNEMNERFCMKLLRNITSLYEQREDDMHNTIRCSYLKHWIYYCIKFLRVPEYIFKNVLGLGNAMITSSDSKSQCLYESYNKFLEPDNIVKLLIFSLNIENIQNIIKDNQHTHYNTAHEYVLECANIYKKMNKNYCVFNKNRDIKHVNTCAELDDFKSYYTLYFSEGELIGNKVPDLNITELDDVEELQVQQGDSPDTAESGFLSGSLQRNITAGTVAAAGTGALLLALNKFTPVGNLFRFGKRGQPRMSNFLDEEPSEKNFLNDPDYLNMHSDTMGFSVGYTPTENY